MVGRGGGGGGGRNGGRGISNLIQLRIVFLSGFKEQCKQMRNLSLSLSLFS